MKLKRKNTARLAKPPIKPAPTRTSRWAHAARPGIKLNDSPIAMIERIIAAIQ